ncbi:MAG: hypothetical protein LBR07_06675 [Puniceicoccales bacterium]|nr:hypothetical protein [Puniceicoccales bacterium]
MPSVPTPPLAPPVLPLAFPALRAAVSRRRDGFVLIIALVLMATLLVTTLVLLMFVALQIRLTGTHADLLRARANVRFAAAMALGELQLRVGPDRAATVPDLAQERAGWTLAVRKFVPHSDTATGSAQDSESGTFFEEFPLVSGGFYLPRTENGTLRDDWVPPFGWTEIASARQGVAGDFPAVRVPWVGNTGESERGTGVTARFAFWVQDESQKADAATTETPNSLAQNDLQVRRQLASPRHAADAFYGVKRTNLTAWRAQVGTAGDWRWLENAWKSDAGGENSEGNFDFPLLSRVHTWEHLGVAADARNGGLRINWEQREPSPLTDAVPTANGKTASKLPCTLAVWEDFFLRKPDAPAKFAKTPAEGLPVTPAGTLTALRRFPIISHLRTRFGVFHTHSDAYSRVRFHADVQLWNPWAHPLTLVEKDRIGLLDFEKMPVLKVSNLTTGAVLTVDMGAFPEGKFAVPQTPSDRTINADILFFNAPHPNLSLQGLYGGGVYHFQLPNPAEKPDGLARTISATKWLIQSDPKKPNTPPSGATGGNWLHATHNIRLDVLMPTDGVTLHIREAKGTFDTSKTSAQYSQPVLTLKNIPFSDWTKTITGAEFDRPLSSSYTAADARFALALCLRPNTPERVLAALARIDPRAPVLDFADPSVAALYEVFADLETGVAAAPATNTDASFWWDATANKHAAGDTAATGTAAGADFAEVRLFDRPSRQLPLSPFALRHLPLDDKPAGTATPRYPIGRETDADWFDRAFFAGAWEQNAAATTGATAPRPWSRNPWLVALRPATGSTGDATTGDASDRFPAPEKIPVRADAAAHVLVRGAFNVNTADPEPWRIVLARALDDWARQEIAPSAAAAPKTKNFTNALPRQPYNPDLPRPFGGREIDLADNALAGAGAETVSRALATQGLRALSDARRDALAKEIAAAIRRRREERGTLTGTFADLRAFALAGVLEDALEKSGVNARAALGREIPPLSPLRLNPGDLLESLGPVLSVRGDTFRVRLRAEVTQPAGRRATTGGGGGAGGAAGGGGGGGGELTVLTRAEAEIVVQRMPEFADLAQEPMTETADLSPLNRHLGRRLKIVAFRWLAPDEED